MGHSATVPVAATVTESLAVQLFKLTTQLPGTHWQAGTASSSTKGSNFKLKFEPASEASLHIILSGVVQWERRNRHLQVEYQLNAAVKAVRLGVRTSSSSNPLPVAFQEIARIKVTSTISTPVTPHRDWHSLAGWHCQ